MPTQAQCWQGVLPCYDVANLLRPVRYMRFAMKTGVPQYAQLWPHEELSSPLRSLYRVARVQKFVCARMVREPVGGLWAVGWLRNCRDEGRVQVTGTRTASRMDPVRVCR